VEEKMNKEKGFTLIEILVATAILVIFIVGALGLYIKSHKISIDQQQLAQMQHDVRSAMFFIARDVRSAGVGLPIEFAGYFLEGVDNESQGGDVRPDRLKIMANLEDPLNLKITDYGAGQGGGAANVPLEDFSFEKYPYPDDYYIGKIVLILTNTQSGCPLGGEVRQVTHVTHNPSGTNERLNFSPGLAPGINPPGGLNPEGIDNNCFDGGTVVFINVKEYWLDVTGHYPGLTPGQNGYIGNGEGGILYLTENGVHYPLARNIENLQFQYNGDWNDDGILDGFTDWQPSWSVEDVAKIRQVRIWILGKTERAFTGVSGTPPQGMPLLYQRPPIANSPGSQTVDRHRRFLLETTVNIRNLSLEIYNQI